MSRRKGKSNIVNVEKPDLIKSLASLSLEDIDKIGKIMPTVVQSKLEEMTRSSNMEDLLKANLYMTSANGRQNGAVKALFFNPNEAADAGNGYKDPRYYGSLPFDTLRRMGDIFIVRAVVNTRIEQIQNYLHYSIDEQKEGYQIRRKKSVFDDKGSEPSREDKLKIEYIRKFLDEGGIHDKWETFDSFQDFGRKIAFDSLTLDQLAFEITRDSSWNLSKFRAVDASLVRYLDSIDPKYKTEFEQYRFKGYLPKYCMIWDNQIVTNPSTKESVVFYPWELGFGIRNKSTNVFKNGYGTSELETLVGIMTWILQGMEYNGNFFSKGSQPKGFLNIKNPNISPATMAEFKQAWQQTMVGVSNCLVGSTWIVTENEGKISLEDCLSGENSKEVKLWTGKNFENGKVFKTQRKKICKMTLDNKMSIESSPEHRFKVVSDNGEIEWKERKDLNVGDYVLCNRKPVEGNFDVYYKGCLVEEDLFEVMGWLIGDGWIDKGTSGHKRLSFYFNSKKEREICKSIHDVLDKYGINNYIHEEKRTDVQIEDCKKRYGFSSVSATVLSIKLSDVNFYTFLSELGFTSSSKGKTIPSFLFKVSSKNRCAFIRGFFSADGSTPKGTNNASITIVQNSLRNSLRDLLMIEGIQCVSNEGSLVKENPFNDNICYDGHMLSIKDKKDFFNRVSYFQDYKCRDYKNGKYPNSIHFLMGLKIARFMRLEVIRRQYFEEDINISRKSLLYLRDGCSKNGFFTCNKIEEIAEEMSFDLPYEFKDFRFSRIISLEDTEEEVDMYDVEVFDKEHQFIANGILTHNSHRTPILNGIDMEWVDLQKLNRDMEFNEWLKFLFVVTCSVYRMDPSELGFQFKDSSSLFGVSGQKERLDHSKNKGLKPLLVFLQNVLNYYLISELDDDFELVFTGIDVEDEEKKVKIDEMKVRNGMVSMEDIFLKYSGRTFNPEKDTILNQSYQLQKQMQMQQAMYGGEGMNEEVDKQTADEGGEEKTEKSLDPFASALMNYIDNNLSS